MPLDHFSHEHPLILKDQINSNGDDEIVCYGCPNPITQSSENVYICSSSGGGGTCDTFYLHKKCAELPKEIQHPMHDLHLLTLLARPPYKGDLCGCNVCDRTDWRWFTYNCLSCSFDSCVTCAFEDRAFSHIGHGQHTLNLMQRPALFRCDACGIKAEDSSYACNSCQFWMHKSCALAPFIVQVDYHHHSLVLHYSLPDIHRSFTEYCRICKDMVHKSCWLYYCYKCSYFVHMKCIATSTSGEKDGTEANLQRDKDLLHFPVLNKESFIYLIIDLFTKGNANIKLEEGGATTHDHPKILNHWSHEDHPLVFLKEADINEKKEMPICNGCIQPISAAHPIYGCIECNFFLHKFCAELPGKLLAGAYSRHAQHPVFLFQTRNKFSVVECVACGLITNGFYYRCVQCDIRFDIRCCFLPDTIKHESHEHPLNYSASSKFLCTACGSNETDIELYKCKSSCNDFQIHRKCALLPSQMRHRWDPHLVSLIYPPFFHEGQIYCEICEEEVNPNYWLYHCHECDQTFHTYCIRPVHNSKVGDKVTVDLHEHALTFVVKTKRFYPRPFLCSKCSHDLGESSLVFECANCDMLFCTACVCSKL